MEEKEMVAQEIEAKEVRIVIENKKKEIDQGYFEVDTPYWGKVRVYHLTNKINNLADNYKRFVYAKLLRQGLPTKLWLKQMHEKEGVDVDGLTERMENLNERARDLFSLYVQTEKEIEEAKDDKKKKKLLVKLSNIRKEIVSVGKEIRNVVQTLSELFGMSAEEKSEEYFRSLLAVLTFKNQNDEYIFIDKDPFNLSLNEIHEYVEKFMSLPIEQTTFVTQVIIEKFYGIDFTGLEDVYKDFFGTLGLL